MDTMTRATMTTRKNTVMNRGRKRYDLRGLKLATIAFAIMALANFAVQVVKTFERNHVVDFVYLGIMFVAWMIMFIACRLLLKYGPDFRAAFIVSIPAMASTVICALMLVSNISSEMGKGASLTIGVQFALYVPFLMMLMAYWYVVRGSAFLCEEQNRLKLAASCKGIRMPVIIVMILALIATQGAPVFSEMIKYIVTGSAAALSLIMQMVIINHLLKAYDAVDGKLEAGRLNDIITGKERNGKEGKDKDKKGKDKRGKASPAAPSSSGIEGKGKGDPAKTEARKIEAGQTEARNTEAGNSEAGKEKYSDTKIADAKAGNTETETENQNAAATPSTEKADAEEAGAGKAADMKAGITPDAEEAGTKIDDAENDNSKTIELARVKAEDDNSKTIDLAKADAENNNSSGEDSSAAPEADTSDIIEEDWLRKELEENDQPQLETAFFSEPDIKIHTETKE